MAASGALIRLADFPRGLFFNSGSEGHILAYPDSPSSQTILEIHV